MANGLNGSKIYLGVISALWGLLLIIGGIWGTSVNTKLDKILEDMSDTKTRVSIVENEIKHLDK